MSLTTMALMNIDGYNPKYTWKWHVSNYFCGLNEKNLILNKTILVFLKLMQISVDLRRLLILYLDSI